MKTLRERVSGRIWAVALLLALTGTACTSATVDRQESAADQSDTEADDPGFTVRYEAVRVRIVVNGLAEIDWTAETDLKIIEAPDSPVGQPIFAVGFDGPLQVDERTFVRVGADIFGHLFGQGQYQIDGNEPGASPGFDNGVLFLLSRSAEAVESVGEGAVEFSHAFNHRVQPCHLEIGDGGATGRLECPEMADDQVEEDVRASVLMTWEFLA